MSSSSTAWSSLSRAESPFDLEDFASFGLVDLFKAVRRLTCDGALISMLENAKGEILNVGRKSRVIPRAIQRALEARDTNCQFPGCHHSRHLQAHHLVHRSRGGETKFSDLVMICARHHREVHEFGVVFPSH